jgi:hypothetical protein
MPSGTVPGSRLEVDLRRWRWLIALALVVSACGGSDSGGDTTVTESLDKAGPAVSPEGVVESGDVLASLSLASESLPEGVSLDDVRVEVMVTENAVPGVPAMMVQLLPDGLVLSEPAALTVALPEAPDGGLLALHISGDSVEFLGGEIQQDDEGFSFRTTVEHFSRVSFYLWSDQPWYETSLSANPDHVSVGQTQRADVTITKKPGVLSLWLTFYQWDLEDTYRLFRFSPPERLDHYSHFGAKHVVWDQRDPTVIRWDPRSVSEIFFGETGVEELFTKKWEASVTSECVSPNNWGPSFRTTVYFDLTLLQRGEPEEKSFWEDGNWEEAVVEASPPGSVTRHTDQSRSEKLLEVPLGDTLQASANLWARAPSVCAAADTTTTTTTTTEPPTEEEEEGDQNDSDTSETVAAGEGEPAGDMSRNPRYVPGDFGEHCFIGDVVGPGETVATTAGNWFDVIVSVNDPAGEVWRANAAYFGPTPTDRGVYLGPPEPGQQKLEGATATIEWDDSDTFRVCVDGGETMLGVASFTVSVGISTSNGTFWDYATGIGEA